MVDAKRLLTDLKRLHRDLSRDPREQHAASPQRDAAQTEWREAFDANRTADTFETFWTAAIDQALPRMIFWFCVMGALLFCPRPVCRLFGRLRLPASRHTGQPCPTD